MNQNLSKDKYIYEFATEADGEEIAVLLEEAAFDSDITVTYARRPNAYLSVMRDGNKCAIITAKNTQTQKIIGIGICIINTMTVKGEAVNVAYLCGLRINNSIGVNIIKSYQLLGEFCRQNNVKYTYTTILADNQYAIKMLKKRRKAMPMYVKHSEYIVNFLSKNLKYNSIHKCSPATEDDFDALYKFIQKESKDKIFFPHLTEQSLKNGFYGLTYKDFYLLKDQMGEILCCGILWKQWDYKQVIVKRYSLKYRILKLLASPILNLMKYPKPPKENTVIKYPTLAFVLSKDNNPDYLEDFVRQISHQIPKECEFFVFAATENSPEIRKVFGLTSVKYKSLVYLVDWDKVNGYDDLLNQNIYIECGLL